MTVIPLAAWLTGCTPTDTATWRTDTAAAETDLDTTEAGEEDWEDEGEDDWEEGDEYAKVQWGLMEGDEGWTGFYLSDPEAGGELCDLEYEAKWVTTTECTDCLEAWIITRGSSEVWLDVDGACAAEGWTELEGTRFGVGYDSETLWADLGAGWEAIEEADGEREGDFAFFEIWLED